MNRSSASEIIGVIALLAVTLVWALSFGIIGRYLTGVDAFWVALARLLIAALCFLPFLRLRKLSVCKALILCLIGALQFGVMYVSYLSAFQYLEAWQVALFSIFTPLWIALSDSILARRWAGRILLAAFLSVAGAAVIRFSEVPSGGFWTGFLLMQVSNIAFGLGQVWFREWKFRNPDLPEKDVFALLYMGGMLVAAAAAFFSGSLFVLPGLNPSGWLALIYLGLVASGLGFFFWNYGASRVSAGFLAASNNLVIPIGIVFALLLNDSTPRWSTLIVGSTLIAMALFVGRKTVPRKHS